MEKGNEGIWVQKRDLEILIFCLEMKFADIESLNQMYFDANSLDMFGARKRVQKLEAHGLLRSVSLLSGTSKKFYLTSSKGYRELLKSTLLHGDNSQNSHPLNTSVDWIPKPISKLSVVTFEHDFGVLKTRMLLEKQGRATNWRSEKSLKKQAHQLTKGLQRDFMPDGIFTSKHGVRCAFEFENRPKSGTQLQEKIFRLSAIMSQTEPVFAACLFVASSDNLKSKIQNITKNFPGQFVVQSVMDLKKNEKGS